MSRTAKPYRIAKRTNPRTPSQLQYQPVVRRLDGSEWAGSKFKLLREAEAEAVSMMDQLRDGRVPRVRDSSTLAEFIRAEMESRVYYPSSRLAHQTRANLLVRVAGDVKLADIDVTESRRIHRLICEAHSVKKRPYARSFQKLAWNLYGTFVRSAHEAKLLTRGNDPYLPSRVEWPYQEQAKSGSAEYVSPEDRERFLAVVAKERPDRLVLVKLLWDGGLRIGEALPLSPEDFEPLSNTLNVRRTVTRTSTGAITVGPTKGKRERRIQLSAEMGRTLRQQIRDGASEELIFPSPRGGDRVLSYMQVLRDWQKWSEKAGLRSSPHVARHSAATDLIRAGVHDSVVAQQLGHSSTKTLGRYYSHVQEQDLRDAMEMRAAWEAKRKSGPETGQPSEEGSAGTAGLG
jgi:integrase